MSLIIIDGYSFVFRAFYSLPPLTSKKGVPVGALYGFANMLHRVWQNADSDLFAVVFDAGKTTFRSEIYPEYKANRPDAPDDLKVQFPLVREVTEAMNIRTLEKDGFEADDIIATLVKQHPDQEITIYSSDKDLMQLVNDKVKLYDPIRKKTYGIEQVKEKFGVGPEKLLDYLSLIGDSSDNVPGVPSIGPKTAVELLTNFGSLDGVYENLANIKQNKRRTSLEENKDLAYLSKTLITLANEVDIDLSADILKKHPLNEEKFTEFCQKYGFDSLLHKINIKPVRQSTSNIIRKEISEKTALAELDSLLDQEQVFINLISANEIAFFNNIALYIVKLAEDNSQVSLFAEPNLLTLADLKPLFEKLYLATDLCKICFNVKALLKLFLAENIIQIDDLPALLIRKDFHDLKAINYLLGASEDVMPLAEESKKHTPDWLDIAQQVTSKFPYALQSLHSNKLLNLYYNLDLPNLFILLKIEYLGFKVSVGELANLSENFAKEIAKYQSEIFKLSGEEFNIASPKQLGEILYEKMGLLTNKKSSKTKAKSTSHEVLEQFAAEGVEIAGLILKWRHFSKLKSTYTDSLQKQVDHNSRVHTNLSSTSTSTGRLSSNNPNLQNIPVRTIEGDKIRKSFIAEQGKLLISADYSQIELRLLAHIAGVKSLQKAFLEQQDIHNATACEVFNLTKEEVTSEYRRKAKTINFGIIYGISAFGLAERLGISRQDAKEFIERYFERFPEIKQYMEDIVSSCKEKGYVSTLFGRKLYFKDINSSNYSLRSFTERAVINAPLQGSAADIIKQAMLNIELKLAKEKLAAQVILQVHDELIYEVPEAEVEQVSSIIKLGMESCVNLTIPLTVDTKIGNNWYK